MRAGFKGKPSPPLRPGAGVVPLDCTEGIPGLNGAVHTQQGTVDTVEVGKGLLKDSYYSYHTWRRPQDTTGYRG